MSKEATTQHIDCCLCIGLRQARLSNFATHIPCVRTGKTVADVYTLGAGDLERRRPGLLRGGVLRLCLSLKGEDRRLGGERGKRPRGDRGLQAHMLWSM